MPVTVMVHLHVCIESLYTLLSVLPVAQRHVLCDVCTACTLL